MILDKSVGIHNNNNNNNNTIVIGNNNNNMMKLHINGIILHIDSVKHICIY